VSLQKQQTHIFDEERICSLYRFINSIKPQNQIT